MRHLGSIVLSLIFAPLIYVLAGIGMAEFSRSIDGRTAPDFVPAVLSLGALLVAGVLYAILTISRLSPLGTMIAGLAFLAIGFWALVDPTSLRDTIPRDVLGVDNAGRLAAGPIMVLLSVPLLATVVSTRRWQRYDRVEPPAYGASYGGPAESDTSPYAPDSTPRYAPHPPSIPGFRPTSPAPAYPTAGQTSPAYPTGYPTSPAYPTTYPTSPTSPAYPAARPMSPAYPAAAPKPRAYPSNEPTWPGADVTDAAEETRPLPPRPAPYSPGPAGHPPPPGSYPPASPASAPPAAPASPNAPASPAGPASPAAPARPVAPVSPPDPDATRPL
ncbi:MAG TPA: hypothetical protein VGJ53_03300 [Micromonosporaceae bacterium]